ncbi:MAG: hypothetical protein R3B72_05845 [Polyangiaceae bacterium]
MRALPDPSQAGGGAAGAGAKAEVGIRTTRPRRTTGTVPRLTHRWTVRRETPSIAAASLIVT